MTRSKPLTVSIVRNSHLRFHPRPHWAKMDFILGFHSSRHRHVSRRRILTSRNRRHRRGKHRESISIRSRCRIYDFYLHISLWSHMVNRPLAISRRDIPIGCSCTRKCMGSGGMECWKRMAGKNKYMFSFYPFSKLTNPKTRPSSVP